MTRAKNCVHHGHFDPSGAEVLPPAARRWLCHAIEPGAPLYRQASIAMHGEIRIGRWRPFTATQSLAPGRGYRWAADTSIMGLPVSGYDTYTDGSAQMHWRILGVMPIMSGAGLDIELSAAGRLAAEAVLVPTSLVDAQWQHVDADHAVYVVSIDGHAHRVLIEVDPQGVLRRVTMQRWGKPAGASGYGFHRFSVAMEAESRFGELTIASRMVASWPDGGTDGEFYRAKIDSVHLH